VHTPSQIACAEFVKKDPSAKALAPFYQQKRDLFLQLTAGSRFRPLPCGGTYFQLFDYSAISKETDKEIAHRLIVEHGVASIPVSAFLYKDTGGPVLRFCFAKKDETLRAAAERLVKI
jgi:methionine aminotransferase